MIHRATLGGLVHGKTYTYRCGAGGVWSAWFTFDFFAAVSSEAVRFAVVADLDGREKAGIATITALGNAAKKSHS